VYEPYNLITCPNRNNYLPTTAVSPRALIHCAMNKTRLLILTLSLLLVTDFTYSFMQYYNTPLDGDMAGGIIPAEDVKQIFKDPFGINAIKSGERHPNPNRYFAHLFFRDYFRTTPFIYQKITNPVNSVYLSTATIKIIVHLTIVFLFSFLVTNSKKLFTPKVLFIALIITPFFQAFGYRNSIGIITHSITYTFFYALPMILIIAYYFPFYKIIVNNRIEKINIFTKISLGLLTVILPFNGPLLPPIIIIVSLLILTFYYKKSIQKHPGKSKITAFLKLFKLIPPVILWYTIPIFILSCYSLYLGTYNSTYQNDIPMLADRYSNLPLGIYQLLTLDNAFLYLFSILAINSVIIRIWFYTSTGKIVLSMFKWIGLFSLIYLALLPMGGYRPYRPNVVRFDTFLPITLMLIYFFAYSSFYIIKHISKYHKMIYIPLLLCIVFIYTKKDRSFLNECNCEKSALFAIAISNQDEITVKGGCNVLSWDTYKYYSQSKMNSKLLKYWNITTKEKRYCHVEEE